MSNIAHCRPSRSFAQSATHWITLPALIALAGCGSDAMSLGSNEVAVAQSECLAGPIDGDLIASSQADIDALRGCRELPGSLRVVVPSYAPGSISLEPLSELQRVHGQLQISGPISSLAGLESLEAVGVLHLLDTDLTDLLPLRGLTRVDNPADWQVDGIRIDHCAQLVDLRGLENLTSWGSLQITQSDALVSLAGLQAPERVESIRLISLPQLGDVNSLAPVRVVGFFDLTSTAVTRFDEFALERADTLNLANNPLTDLDGLRRLEEVGDLNITGNAALVRLGLPALRAYENVDISGNPVLLTLLEPEAGWASSDRFSGLEGVPGGFAHGMLSIGDNPLVTSIEVRDPYNFERIVIYRNASLGTLSIPYVQRADTVWIQDNAALSSVDMPLLAQVATLTVRDNPALSVAPFAGVQTFQSEISGNLDTLAP
jgi:hypothetical protein